MTGRRQPVLGVVVCLLMALKPAFAQDAPTLLFQGGAARDVADSPEGDRLYVALYSSDEVIAVDAASGAEMARVRVGDGPASLIADNASIAVLNRAGASVSILHAADLSVRATVPVSGGTNALVAAGPERIAAIDPFEARVTVIDLTSGATVTTTQLAAALPVGAAFVDGSLMVVSRTSPAALIRLDANTLAETGRVAFDGVPRAMAACGSGRVAIATDDALVLMDLSSMQTVRTEPIALTALIAVAGGVMGIQDAEIRGFDHGLNAAFTAPAPDGARGARIVRGNIVAWAPALGRVWRVAAVPVLASSPNGQSLQSGATLVAEAPLEPEPTPDSIAVAEAPEPATPVEPVAPAPDSEAAVAASPAPEVSPDPAAEPATAEAESLSPLSAPEDPQPVAPETIDEPAVPYHLTVRPTRPGLGGSRPYAPRFGDPTGRTIREELDRALTVAADGDSLTTIDFGSPPKNLEFAGKLSRTQSGAGQKVTIGPSDVQFDIDDAHVKTDTLSFSTVPQELVLEGNVDVTRGNSTLTADRIRAFNVKPPVVTGRPLVPSNREKSIPHPLVPRGYKPPEPGSGPVLGIVEMTNMNWVEPDRSLVSESVQMNSLARNADLHKPHGRTGPMYFGAERLQMLGPDNVVGTDFWVTTCDDPVPHYRLRLSRVEGVDGEAVKGSHARLQLGQTATPFYVPRLTASLLPGDRRLRTELSVGRASDLGNFLNVAQWFQLSDNIDVAPRLYITTQQGTGFGFDSEYNFMRDPASAMFRSEGKLQTLYTTEKSGYTHWYHRQEFTPDTVLLGQWEQWYEEGFYKDFYADEYENRTGPRTFVSVAHTQEEWMATATAAKATHDFTAETEKLPELTFSMFERKLAGNLYGTFDTIGGFYETQPETVSSMREVTVGRLSYDWNVARGFNVLPFVEMDATYYSNTLDDDQDDFRGSATVGVTAQARLQRSFAGIRNFSGFKHLIVPSATLSFRPDTTLDSEDTPRFDDYDDRPGRFRIESTIDNILLGRNGPTGEIWPVARLTLYQGNDFENEAVRSNDYEVELEVRPRPAWGLQAVGEMHDLDEDDDLPGSDFNRLLTYLFYDNKLSKNSVNGRIGFAYTESSNDVLNQEILYGLGYRITGRWSAAFEQRYDFERDEMTRQTFSVRRKFHDWEVGLSVRDKESGIDIGLEINLVNFPEIGLGL